MKPILFSLFLFPLFLAAQGSWSDPIYTYDATGNRISRHRDPLRRANPHPVAPAWQLTLSPNPSEGRFLLRSNLPLDGAELHVYDLSGRSVLRQSLTGELVKLDLRQQPAGVYVFRVQRGTERWEAKGVKE